MEHGGFQPAVRAGMPAGRTAWKPVFQVHKHASSAWREPAPIGFYFAKLWYYERLYPLIFTVGALGKAASNS